ncbi:MAG: hypothetical protein GQ574_16775 [Crocinitomix sp.]|nr:hypothetical protein [Crocinitomix sp.]
MKVVYILFLLFLTSVTFGQKDTIRLDQIDFCQDVFKESPTDSTFSHYCVKDMDTLYFSEMRCVIMPQLTTPGTVIWKTKDGLANGEIRYCYSSYFGYSVRVGEYSKGYFVNGIETEYFKNGNIKSTGKYSRGERVGSWKYFLESGELEFECEFVDGICSDL